jgi:hypothetical protein
MAQTNGVTYLISWIETYSPLVSAVNLKTNLTTHLHTISSQPEQKLEHQ